MKILTAKITAAALAALPSRKQKTANLRTHVRTFGIVSALTLTGMIALTGPATAKDAPNVVKIGCEGAGYLWSDTLGCANKSCPDGGKPGDVRVSMIQTPGAAALYYVCDGFTGKWTSASVKRPPTPPKVPSPNVRVLNGISR